MNLGNKLESENWLCGWPWPCHGDFWHGNPKFYSPETKVGNRTASDLYRATILKRAKYKENGYNLVEIWEHEWDEIKKTLN